MAEIGQQPMQAILTEVCRAAKTVTEADCVLLYPFKEGMEPYTYDPNAVGHVGLEYDLQLQNTFEHQGVTEHILRSGTLVVHNVLTHQSSYAGRPLADHTFVQRERLQALIGIAVRDVSTPDVLGVLFLDYRSPQMFTEQDRIQAESFASLAAVAIRNARQAEEMRQEN